MRDEAGRVGRDPVLQSLLNLVKDINLHFQGNGGPFDCSIQRNDHILLALKENGLEEGQIEGNEGSQGPVE